MHPQKDALVRLLADNDEQTVRMVKESLAQEGSGRLDDLRDLAGCDNPLAALHARDVVHEVVQREALEKFEKLCPVFGDDSDLEEACWLLSGALLRGFEAAPYRQRIDAWGAELKRRLRRAPGDRHRVEIMTDFIASELVFAGNADDYYNERNSLLPCVLDSRKGIPISLTLVYMLVGHHAGAKVEGVNLPGHFLARHGAVLFDPFHHGRVLARGDCREILRRQNQNLEEWHLAAAGPRQMLARMLANLLYVYHRQGKTSLYERVKLWSHLLYRG
ncbi:MAG: transglutaminase family protein [Chthoniobacterales bacterium]|jgi:regulator of sirC expression with transglutaminase-like and TPR domain|nr:transglutaminase family protein [Chthoniobacterales bacterium]